MTERNKKHQSRRERRRERWETFKRTWPQALELARPQARRWAFGLGLLLVARLAGLVLPAAPKFILDQAIPERDMQLFGIIVGIVLVAAVLQGLSNFGLTQIISKAGQRLIADLRLKLQDHVSRLPTRYFDNHKTGEVVSRVMDDVENVRNLVGTGMVELLGGLITAALAVLILFYLNWQLTIAIVLCVGIFFGVVGFAFTVLGPIFRERQEIKADLSGRLTESIGGMRVVKAYNTEQTERTVFAGGVGRLLANVLRTINAISLISLTTSTLLGVLGATILWFGGRQIMAGTFTTGEFVTYVLYLGFMIAPLAGAMMQATQLSEVFAGIERMNELLGEPQEDPDEAGKATLPRLEGRVELRAVSFAYEESKPVLHDINLQAPPGSVTAVVGPSGSGKSTLIGLIASFYRPTEGAVLVDGHDLATVRLSDYRAQLGVVLQDNFLFAGTIRENLLYARPGATEEQLLLAGQLAHCEEFVSRFPDGYDTIIGERGVKLSGGQRQRVAIARALLADPRILILDEATSALDSESEAAIQEGLATLMEGRTTFVIAHRLSTIRHAGRIIVLDGGRIVEHGTHDDLIRAGGKYADMWSLQAGFGTDLFLTPGAENGRREDEEAADASEERRKRAAKLAALLSGE